MFTIKIRIADDIDELQDAKLGCWDERYGIEGFIRVSIGSHGVGIYYDNPLREGLIGMEDIDWWLSSFLSCADNIQETGYVAFIAPDTVDYWLEFSLVKNTLVFNAATPKAEVMRHSVIHERIIDFAYSEPINTEISISAFFKEIICATKFFLTEIEAINPDLLLTRMGKDILRLLESVEHKASCL